MKERNLRQLQKVLESLGGKILPVAKVTAPGQSKRARTKGLSPFLSFFFLRNINLVSLTFNEYPNSYCRKRCCMSILFVLTVDFKLSFVLYDSKVKQFIIHIFS